MKVSPPAALAAWAIGTAWLLTYVFLERYERLFGEGLSDLVQIGSGLLAVIFYRPIRKWFAAWLEKKR